MDDSRFPMHLALGFVAFVLSLICLPLAQSQSCTVSNAERQACLQRCSDIRKRCILAAQGEDPTTQQSIRRRCEVMASTCQERCPSQIEIKQEGWVRPKYYVLSVLYAPPGSAGGAPASASYADSSTTGTSMSVSNSFAAGTAVSASAAYFAAIGAGYASSTSTENSSTVETRKQVAKKIELFGPPIDGIDHERDMIYLWLNPQINIKVCGTRVEWSPGLDPTRPSNSQEGGKVIFVYAGELKHATVHPTRLSDLTAAGITETDYPAILAHDVLAAPPSISFLRSLPFFQSDDPSVYPNRYAYVTSFDYEPPYQAGDELKKQERSFSNEDAVSSGTSYEDSHSVECTVSAGLNLGMFGATVTASQQWTWTDSTTYSTSAAHTQSASASVTQPSYDWRGPLQVLVWWDTIYSSFAFSFPVGAPSLTGVLVQANRPLAFKEVIVNVGGRKYRTRTNANGKYSFYYLPYGKARMQFGGTTTQVKIGNKTIQHNIDVH